MRQLSAGIVTALFTAGLCSSSAQADNVEIKGVHLCCGACQKAASAILNKVQGVSDVVCDRKSHTVTFTTADHDTAKKAFHKLLAGGFYGKATIDGKKVTVKNSAGTDKANKVTADNVHVCCGSCKSAIAKLFPGATITYSGSDRILKNVTIEGENLEPAAVLETLRKAGFNGTVK